MCCVGVILVCVPVCTDATTVVAHQCVYVRSCVCMRPSFPCICILALHTVHTIYSVPYLHSNVNTNRKSLKLNCSKCSNVPQVSIQYFIIHFISISLKNVKTKKKKKKKQQHQKKTFIFIQLELVTALRTHTPNYYIEIHFTNSLLVCSCSFDSHLLFH